MGTDAGGNIQREKQRKRQKRRQRWSAADIVCYCVVNNSHGNYTAYSTGLDVGIVGVFEGDFLLQPQSISLHSRY